MMYSIVPNEIIFANQESNEESKVISFHGEVLEVSQIQGNQYKVNRILSTDLKAYLNPQMQPGSIIIHEEASQL